MFSPLTNVFYLPAVPQRNKIKKKKKGLSTVQRVVSLFPYNVFRTTVTIFGRGQTDNSVGFVLRWRRIFGLTV